MTKLEAVETIGDVLTELDVAIGSLMPNDPNHRALLDIRTLLDQRQLSLSRQVFDENTASFQDATTQLKGVDDDIQGTLRDIDHINTVITNATRFLDSATSLLSTVAKLAA
ncbi:hypothetical protein [Tunturiibacter gelidoferens]|uniref:Uncharacterized protein n=1 Tax=Tunturiibacter gelidiferens TaxID=3069689 RepID=A0A9X0U4I2_9BACT|nr:hypothetical protein [Edaphobacter lichenicola]MBB5329424.1 hypothetical protein [Edaphobacter lichenicola]